MIRIIVDAGSKAAVLEAHKDGRLHEAFGDASYRIEEGWPEGPGYMRTIAGASTTNVTYHPGGVSYPGGAGGAGGSSAGVKIGRGAGGGGPDPSIPPCPHCGASGGGGHGGGCPNG